MSLLVLKRSCLVSSLITMLLFYLLVSVKLLVSILVNIFSSHISTLFLSACVAHISYSILCPLFILSSLPLVSPRDAIMVIDLHSAEHSIGIILLYNIHIHTTINLKITSKRRRLSWELKVLTGSTGTVIVWMVVSLPWRQMGNSQWSWALMMKSVINQTQSISMDQITILK